MGTTFVTITEGTTGEEPGFWMRDAMLELWLRLLSLHLPVPTDDGENAATTEIRNRWLFASRGYFNGCVPHDMEFACSTPQGRAVVRKAIDSLLTALKSQDAPLDAATINLLGIDGGEYCSMARAPLKDIADAFIDLLDGKVKCTARSTAVMPGSKPYTRSTS